MAVSAERVASRFLEGGFLLEAMSNLRPNRTGVDDAVIWISAGEFAGADAQHGPRVKVVLGQKITTDGLRDSVSVTITDPPRVLGTLPGSVQRQVTQFVDRNRDVLLQHWAGEIDAAEIIEQLRRV
jgi:hypothetical protein